MEPMLLIPQGKDYLWGGTRLQTEYGKQLNMVPLAETWECSVHPDGPSVVATGSFAGQTLQKVLEHHPEFLGSKVVPGKELPILVKFIDAAKELSIQVHPNDAYAQKYEGQKGKTEMWYVMDAQPGATLFHGFAHNITKEQLQKAMCTGEILKYLNRVPVHRGDVFFIPPGTIHAIGAGVLVAEIQESSNVTYRVYDYDRIDKDGKKRALHFEKALEVLNLRSGLEVRQKPRMVRYYPGCSRELLCRCEYFETERIQVQKTMSFDVLTASFQVLLCLEGCGELEISDKEKSNAATWPLKFKKGDCIFLPAGLGTCQIQGQNTLLKIRC